MREFVFWYGVGCLVVAGGVIGLVVGVWVREWFWDRDRRRHVACCERVRVRDEWVALRAQAHLLGLFAETLDEINALPERTRGTV